jgi:hypothetical protein
MCMMIAQMRRPLDEEWTSQELAMNEPRWIRVNLDNDAES